MNFAQDGRPISTNFNINIEGTLLPDRGSPMSTKWWIGANDPPNENFINDGDRHNSLIKKQELIRSAFSEPGTQWSYSAPSKEPIKFFPKLINLNFEADPWVIKSHYTAQLESANFNMDESSLSIDDNFASSVSGRYLSSISDDFNIQEREDGTNVLEITRNLAATAFTVYTTDGSGTIVGNEAWLNAKGWVVDRLANNPLVSGDTRFAIPSGVGTYYNIINTETINKFAGSYSLSQKYLYHTGNYYEQRTIQKTDVLAIIGDGSNTTRTTSINGTIFGLDTNNNATNKLNNARSYYNIIATGLAAIAGAYGRSLNISTTEDYAQGTLAYSLEYINATGNTYKHNYDVSFSIPANSNPTVNIAGTVEGIIYDSTYMDSSGHTKFDFAASGWDLVKSTLKSLAFANATVFGGVNYSDNFSANPSDKSVSFNKPNGIINYNYNYSWIGVGGSSQNYREDYTVDISTNNAPNKSDAGQLLVGTIQGTIFGISNDDDPSTKYTNAKTGWSTVKSNLFTRVNNEISLIGTQMPILTTGFVTKSLSLNSLAGIIGYNVTFNNAKPGSDSRIAVTELTMQDDLPSNIIAVQIIPGRASGPIIQNIGTYGERKRNISLSMVLFPKGAGQYWTINDYDTIFTIASGEIVTAGAYPTGLRGTGWFVASDTCNWNPKEATFTRNISCTY